MKAFLLFVLLSGLFFSCVKDNFEPVDQTDNKATDVFFDSKFDWASTNNVEVNIAGIPGGPSIVTKLEFKTLEGQKLFEGFFYVNENITLNLVTLPTTNKLVMQFGQLTDTLSVSNGKASFSFVEPEN